MSSYKLYSYHPHIISELFMCRLFSLFDYSEDILKLEEKEDGTLVGREVDEVEGEVCGRERSDAIYSEVY